MSDKGEQCQPMRAKYWNELSIEEKMERLREQVKSLKYPLNNMNTTLEAMKDHQHAADGSPMVKLDSRVCQERHPERENEYF